MRRLLVPFLLSLASIAVAALAAAPAAAQHPLFVYELRYDQSQVFVELNEPGVIPGVFIDRSNDPPVLPNGQTVGVIPHPLSGRIEYPGRETPPAGWVVSLPLLSASFAGRETPVDVTVSVGPDATEPLIRFRVVVNVTNPDQTSQEYFADLSAYSRGVANYNVLGSGDIGDVKPGDVRDATFQLSNDALLPRSFEARVLDNPCGFGVALPGTMVLDARSSDTYTVGLRAPKERMLYLFGEQCGVRIEVSPQDNPFQTRTYVVSSNVQGVYIQVPTVFWTIVTLLAALLLFVLAKRRKERLEEEILGKPQKPWTIPVERVYLDQLKKEDPRAWYVVRHYLMEDEYRSALLWYRSYKHATKSTRKRERLILKEEKAYARWKAAWQRRVGKPARKAEAKVARLERKAARKARRQHAKAMRRHEKVVARIEAAHAKKRERLMEGWETKAKRALKKGQPEPPRPELAAPELPPAPAPPSASLEGTRQGRKAERLRRRAARKQGDLEVAFEKADARRQQRMERKVERLAQKLDDPEFVREHAPARSTGSRHG